MGSNIIGHKKRDNVSNSMTNGRRQHDVWAGIGYFDNASIKFIVGRMNSVRYINLIKEQINNHAERISGPDYIFQQDNAPVHILKLVQSYFNENNISILPWLARFPDLNIIENCWVGTCSRRIREWKAVSTRTTIKKCNCTRMGYVKSKLHPETI